MVVFKCKDCGCTFNASLNNFLSRDHQTCPSCHKQFNGDLQYHLKKLVDTADRLDLEMYIFPQDTKVSIDANVSIQPKL